MNYTDALVHCPSGFAAVLTEFHSMGLTQYLQYDEAGAPIALGGGIERVYPKSSLENEPIVVYLRGPSDTMLALQQIPFTSVGVLAVVPSGEDVYDAMTADGVLLYEQFYSYTDTITLEDSTVIPNPKAGQLRKMWKFQ